MKLKEWLVEKRALAYKHAKENSRDGISTDYYDGKSYAFYELLQAVETGEIDAMKEKVRKK